MTPKKPKPKLVAWSAATPILDDIRDGFTSKPTKRTTTPFDNNFGGTQKSRIEVTIKEINFTISATWYYEFPKPVVCNSRVIHGKERIDYKLDGFIELLHAQIRNGYAFWTREAMDAITEAYKDIAGI